MRRIMAMLAALVLAACNPLEGANLADQAVEAFHTRLNNGDYGGIYDEADPDMKREVQRHEVVRPLLLLHRGLGNVVRFERKDLTFQRAEGSRPGQASVKVEAFFQNGTVEETFVFTMGQEVKLRGYSFQVTRDNSRPVWPVR